MLFRSEIDHKVRVHFGLEEGEGAPDAADGKEAPEKAAREKDGKEKEPKAEKKSK